VFKSAGKPAHSIRFARYGWGSAALRSSAVFASAALKPLSFLVVALAALRCIAGLQQVANLRYGQTFHGPACKIRKFR
jgi:hypothetical protein